MLMKPEDESEDEFSKLMYPKCVFREGGVARLVGLGVWRSWTIGGVGVIAGVGGVVGTVGRVGGVGGVVGRVLLLLLCWERLLNVR